MAEPFATLEELKEHWRGLPEVDEDEAQQKLKEASLKVRNRFRDLDARIASGDLDRDMVVLVVCRMVKRAMDLPEDVPENAGQISFGAGSFQQSMSFRNTDGAIFLGREDIRDLAPQDSEGEFFNIMPR